MAAALAAHTVDFNHTMRKNILQFLISAFIEIKAGDGSAAFNNEHSVGKTMVCRMFGNAFHIKYICVKFFHIIASQVRKIEQCIFHQQLQIDVCVYVRDHAVDLAEDRAENIRTGL